MVALEYHEANLYATRMIALILVSNFFSRMSTCHDASTVADNPLNRAIYQLVG